MADTPTSLTVDSACTMWVRLQVGLVREVVQLADCSPNESNDTATQVADTSLSSSSSSPAAAGLLSTVRDSAYQLVAKKFPDLVVDGLRDCLLLYLHDPTNPSMLQLLTSPEQLFDGVLIEVVLSPLVETDGSRTFSRPHSLAIHSYKSPHFCDLCGEMLWGLFKQGLKCDGCGLNFHKRCAYKIINNCARDDRKQSLTPISEDGSSTTPCIVSPVSSMIVQGPMNGSASPCTLKKGFTTPGGSLRLSTLAVTRVLQVPHTFVVQNITRPAVCQFCHKLLALFRQALQCKDCQFYCHKKCMEFVPKTCQGENRILREDTGSIDESNMSEDNFSMSRDSDSVYDNRAGDDNTEESKNSESSANIPLMRVVQSVRKTKRVAGSSVLLENWMVHYTSRDKTRKLHYWRLDTQSITMFSTKETSRYFKEIKLNDIVKLEQSTLPQNIQKSHHIFEIHTVDTVYYSGEDCDPTLNDNDKGRGRQLGLRMEAAIRQAILPVTETNSSESANDLNEHSQISVKKDLNQLYKVFSEDILGSGQFGVVYGGIQRASGREVAVKVIDKLRFPHKQESVLKNEVAILKNLHHPGVVNLEDMFETSSKIFVVMEKLRGDMLELILASPKGRLDERLTKFLISQIMKALQYLHARPRCIVHCDLKPENVLLSTGDTFPQVKLCDFGFARIIGEKSFRRSLVGTPAYLAPEVLKSKCYNRSLDMWSVGVIIYVSLSGTFPFNENEDIADQIHNAAFMYPPNPWKEISHDAIHLIGKLLQVKFGNRFTADQSLQHHWLQDYKCWCDLRMLESKVNERYLTYEIDDERWLKHQTDNRLPPWNEVGHNP